MSLIKNDTMHIDAIEKELQKLMIDTEAAKQQFSGNTVFYLSMLNKFCANRDIDNLLVAAADGDAEQIFRIAHSLKGSSGLLYLTPVFTECEQITVAYKNGDLQQVVKKSPRAGKRLCKFRKKLNRLLDRARPVTQL